MVSKALCGGSQPFVPYLGPWCRVSSFSPSRLLEEGLPTLMFPDLSSYHRNQPSPSPCCLPCQLVGGSGPQGPAGVQDREEMLAEYITCQSELGGNLPSRGAEE